MTIQKGNALLANRAGKSSALLLAPSVSQGSALHQKGQIKAVTISDRRRIPQTELERLTEAKKDDAK